MNTLLQHTGRALALPVLLVFAGLATPSLAAQGDGTAQGQAGAEAPRAPLVGTSIAIYVGSELTEDGSVLLGGFGHEPSGHWHEVVPGRTHPDGAAIEVGVTDEAAIPGELTEIPQVQETARYIGTNYSEWAGFPPPLTNGGLNEHHVAARDVWSPSREELVEMTPTPQEGPNYSDLARIVMERATSAREAVEIVGELIDEHGYSTYGGNSHLFADAEEGWVFVDFAGGEGLWAAERLGPDEVRVSYPGYIHEFPVDFQDDPDYMASDNLVDFAVEQGWWDPERGEPFNVQEVYGEPFPTPPDDDPDDLFRYPPEREEEIEAMAPLGLRDMMALVRDPRWSDDASGYGHVAHLRPDVPRDLGTLWMSVAGAVTTPFIPVPIGTEDVPPEYKQHRYMGKGSASQFLDPDYAALEGTRSAFRIHKRLLYHTCENPEEFLRPVTAELEAFEDNLIAEMEIVEQEMNEMQNGNGQERREFLTRETEQHFLDALVLAEHLVYEVETRTREELGGIRMPSRETEEGATWRPESEEMNLEEGFGGDQMHHRCFVQGLDDYPREHGSYDGDRLLDARPWQGGDQNSGDGS